MAKGLSKRTIVNLLLLIVLVVLVYFIIYKPQQIFKPTTQPPLFSIESYDADEIVIQTKSKPAITLQKKNKIWTLVKPAHATIDQNKVKLLLTIMQEPVVATYPIEGNDLESFGLVNPRRKITINGELLEFGKINPLTLNRYLLKDEQVHTMSEIIYGLLGAGLPPLLSYQLIQEGEELTAVKVPETLNAISMAQWQSLTANNISEQDVVDSSMGEVILTTVKETYHYRVLAIRPKLVLYRKDLGISYQFSSY